MPTWQENLIIGTGMLRKYYGQLVACYDSGVTHVAIWPQFNSGGPKAEFMIIRAGADVYMAVDEPTGVGAGPLVGVLESDTNYGFPIHPNVATLQFKAVTSTLDVQLNWIVVR